ncbi:MAG: hypothetical protein HY276_03540 [Ignavibacteriales bacterium]|nr:hypothetical protein [Ignavibacteriales bacterium]MBI3787309.1 hypothetical protein [Ignavibacteriales bacterium]
MSETKKLWLQVASGGCSVVGLMLFLSQTDSRGEAPQSFKLLVPMNEITVMGMILVFLGLAAIIVLQFMKEKKDKAI